MLTLFLLIVMRMSGAIAFNPVFGRTNVPSTVRAGFTLAFSLMMYAWTGGVLAVEPVGFVDFAVLAVKELLLGFVLGFGMELAIMVIRFGTAIMDYMMGLSMAQVYDPSSNTQMTVSTGIYTMFMMLVLMVKDGHLRFLQILFGATERIPFGAVVFNSELPAFMVEYFASCIIMGMQFAMPIIVIELLTEVGVGVLMKIVPQINIFAVNFQIKILIGLIMLLILFNPMSELIDKVWLDCFDRLYEMVGLLSG